ncbi:hypothetical protein [Actinomadura spongiicola]|uniref:hypothetical protein n=1 Tax=Actinomadura spongiicola TaxID=2303421 RepID=UPI0011C10FCE|nr:hypothetical protein [Actinomadura spongiicola]
MAEEAASQSPDPPNEGETERKLVVFAPRIDPTLREQIEGIRGITGQTVNEVGQEALQGWVEGKLGDEDVRAKAMEGIEEEERRLQDRRDAIAKVLGSAATPSEKAPEGGGTGRGGRRGKSADT